MKNKSKFMYLILLLLMWSCSNYNDEIVNFTETKYGEKFTEGEIDLKEVFPFQWNKLYIFSPLMDPQDISKELGFDCDCGKVPDDEYLYIFVNDNKVVKKDRLQPKIGFSNDNHMGVHLISSSDANFRITKVSNNNYWLHKK